MKLVVGLTAVAVTGLMCAQPTYAQGPLAVSGGVGVGVIKLPSGQNGVLTSGNVTTNASTDKFIVGPNGSLSAAVQLGKLGDMDTFFGVNVFGTYGKGSWNDTTIYSGVGTVIIPGVSLPDNGSITLTTTRGASATASSSVQYSPPDGTGPYSAVSSANTPGPGDGVQTGADVQAPVGSNSFGVSGSNTAVASGVGNSLAYGGIADESGSILIIAGNLDGLSISTSITTQVLYGGGDVTLGVSKLQDEGLVLQAYAGPSYRYIGQWSTTSIGADMTVNIPEVTGSTSIHPLWSQDTTIMTSLNSHYFGGVVGGGIQRAVSDKVTIGVGAEASLYYATAYLRGQGSVRTHDGQDGGGIPSPDRTVVQDLTTTYAGQLAYAVRAQASATYALSETTALTLAGSVDYLSAVARPYGGAVVTGTNGNASWTSGANNGNVSFGDMLGFTLTASLTGAF